MRELQPQLESARRGMFLSLGALCTAMGTVGIVVPGLPTTVFLLLASYFFARSSPRLHRRLLAHPRLGPYLQMAQDRAMPLRAKVISLLAMWTGIGGGCLALAGTAWAIPFVLGTVAAGAVGTAVLLTWVKTMRPAVEVRPLEAQLQG